MTMDELAEFAAIERIDLDEALDRVVLFAYFRGARVGGEVAVASHRAFIAGEPIAAYYDRLEVPHSLIELLTGESAPTETDGNA